MTYFVYVEWHCLLNKTRVFCILILVFLKVSSKEYVGTKTGHLDSECYKDCPSSCERWSWAPSGSWEEDTSLSVKCEGRVLRSFIIDASF